MIPTIETDQIESFLEKLITRQAEVSQEITTVVRKVMENVRINGNSALFEYTQQFDGVDISSMGMEIKNAEIESAFASTSKEFIGILCQAAENIRRYHEKGKQQSWLSWEEKGVVLGQRVTPLERVGLYVPGGRAAYPSSLLMAAVPAQVAGVEELIVVSPPDRNGNINPTIMAAAHSLGIDKIFRIGGAQAVGALTFGTETIPKVDKIVGPGNAYVAEAKRQVFGTVDIDMIAGPSEVAILADASANPGYIASDLLAQAEHDPLASSICVTSDRELVDKICIALETQAKTLSREDVFKPALSQWGGILIVHDLNQGIDIINRLAPEHLGLHVEAPWDTIGRIRNAGAVFLGDYSPETVGDYWAGPNHILPTNRTARFSSPLGTEDFVKRSSLIQYSREALHNDANSIITFAEKEGLDGHANAVRQRIR